MNLKEQLDEIKKLWFAFLLFGIIYITLSAGLSAYVSTKVAGEMQGPPCRIDFSEERFLMTNSTYFNLQYLFINLRDKDLLIEKNEAYCLWLTKEESKEESEPEEVIVEQPIVTDIPAPKELEKFPASDSGIRTILNCRSPDKVGLYTIKLITRTTSGVCEGSIIMEVKK